MSDPLQVVREQTEYLASMSAAHPDSAELEAAKTFVLDRMKMAVASAASMTPGKATEIMQLLSATPLCQASRADLASMVNAKVCGLRPHAGKQTLQACLHLQNYLTEEHWGVLLNKEFSYERKVGFIMALADKLGLTNPTEMTRKSMVAMMMLAHYSGGAISQEKAFHLNMELKRLFKNMPARKIRGSHHGTVQNYPEKPSDLRLPSQCLQPLLHTPRRI